MSSCLEVQPSLYTVVVGPKFAAEIARETLDLGTSNGVPTFAFSNIVDHGIAFLLDKENFASEAERAKVEARYKNAYELDPVFVLRKILCNIKTAGCYEDWLSQLFACNLHSRRPSRSLECLLALQSLGLLLVYVHCDDILARASNLPPVPMDNEEQVERWARGELQGFLQVHGVYSQPDTVQLDCELYDNASHPLHATAERLKRILGSRHTVLLGSDWEHRHSDPLLAKFCERFVHESTERHSFVFCQEEEGCIGAPWLPVGMASPLSLQPMTQSSADLCKWHCSIVYLPCLTRAAEAICWASLALYK